MGDDSSKNNNQIYCLIKFSLFLLCHVKINKKLKKGNIPSVSEIELLLTLFLGNSGSSTRQSFRMNDILKKGRLQKISLHESVCI